MKKEQKYGDKSKAFETRTIKNKKLTSKYGVKKDLGQVLTQQIYSNPSKLEYILS